MYSKKKKKNCHSNVCFRVALVKDVSGSRISLYSIHAHPINEHQFCVSGHDQFVRVYDRRCSTLNFPVLKYCPRHLVSIVSNHVVWPRTVFMWVLNLNSICVLLCQYIVMSVTAYMYTVCQFLMVCFYVVHNFSSCHKVENPPLCLLMWLLGQSKYCVNM